MIQFTQQLTWSDYFGKNEVAARGKSRRKAVFAFLGKGNHVAGPNILRTRVYVDDYNVAWLGPVLFHPAAGRCLSLPLVNCRSLLLGRLGGEHFIE